MTEPILELEFEKYMLERDEARKQVQLLTQELAQSNQQLESQKIQLESQKVQLEALQRQLEALLKQ